MKFLAHLPCLSTRRTRIVSSTLIAVSLLIIVCGLSVQAAPADLDPTFGAGGKVLTEVLGTGDTVTAIAVQPDGKIIVAGHVQIGSRDNFDDDFALVRYNNDGTLDTTFGNGGRVVTSFSTGPDRAFAIAIQGDRKILVAGTVVSPIFATGYDFGLARYNSDGSLDSGFGSGGKVTTDFMGGTDGAYAAGIQTDGKIVVAGSASTSTGNHFALARYNTNGSLDPTFDGDGRVIADSLAVSFAYGIAIQSDGKIIAAGTSDTVTQSYDFALARYNPDGSPDSTFDGDGIVKTDFSERSDDGAYAVAIQADHKIVVAGETSNNTSALARYNVDGSLDTTFGSNGKVASNPGPDDNETLWNLTIQANGKIIIAGNNRNLSGSGPGYSFLTRRFNSNGSPDPTFGTNGRSLLKFYGRTDEARAVALQPDGKIIIAGYSNNDNGFDFALARYLGDGASPTLATEEISNQAIALDSVTMQRSPFSIINNNNFSADHRTRLNLFVWNLGLNSGENFSAVTAQAEDSQHRIYPLTVEYAGQVPKFFWLSQVTIKLPNELGQAGDVTISVSLHGVTSNQGVVRIQ